MSSAYTFRIDSSRQRALVVHPADATDGWVRVDLGTGAAVLVCDRAAGLLAGPGVGVRELACPYVLPAPYLHHRAGILRARLGAKTVTDDVKVSVADLPSCPGRPALVRRGTYVDQQVTNELGRSVVLDPAGGVLVDAAQLWTDGAGTVLPLSQSRCANNLGVALLALTADGHVLCGRRAGSAAVAPGRLDLTCSGSCDHPGVFPAALQDYVASELRRELAQEAGVGAGAEFDITVFAVVRDLARGGKPDVYAFARLPTLAADVFSGDDLVSHVDLGVPTGPAHLASLLRAACRAGDASTGLLVAAHLAARPAQFPHAASALCALFAQQ